MEKQSIDKTLKKKIFLEKRFAPKSLLICNLIFTIIFNVIGMLPFIFCLPLWLSTIWLVIFSIYFILKIPNMKVPALVFTIISIISAISASIVNFILPVVLIIYEKNPKLNPDSYYSAIAYFVCIIIISILVLIYLISSTIALWKIKKDFEENQNYETILDLK